MATIHQTDSGSPKGTKSASCKIKIPPPQVQTRRKGSKARCSEWNCVKLRFSSGLGFLCVTQPGQLESVTHDLCLWLALFYYCFHWPIIEVRHLSHGAPLHHSRDGDSTDLPNLLFLLLDFDTPSRFPLMGKEERNGKEEELESDSDVKTLRVIQIWFERPSATTRYPKRNWSVKGYKIVWKY